MTTSKQTETDHTAIIEQRAMDAIKAGLAEYQRDSVWTTAPHIERSGYSGYEVRRDHHEDGIDTIARVSVIVGFDSRNSYSQAFRDEDDARKRLRIKVWTSERSYADREAFKWRKAETVEQFAKRVVEGVIENLASCVSAIQHRRVVSARKDVRKDTLKKVHAAVQSHLKGCGADLGYAGGIRACDGRYDHGEQVVVEFKLDAATAAEQLEKIFGIKFK